MSKSQMLRHAFLITKFIQNIKYWWFLILNPLKRVNSKEELALLWRFCIDLNNNLNIALMFLLKVLMTHYLHTTINLVAIGDFCIFGIQYGVGNILIYFGMDTEK